MFFPFGRVDFFIEGVSIFTGYSMVSSPALMTNENKLELAIKYSDYPPTEWVHLEVSILILKHFLLPLNLTHTLSMQQSTVIVASSKDFTFVVQSWQ